MKPVRDPEGAELKHLVAACELAGKLVLEIGCGDGAFTRQYARMADSVVGIDPLAAEVKLAKKKTRRTSVQLLVGRGEGLPISAHIFDIAIFACSL